jgi:hypothetical protein
VLKVIQRETIERIATIQNREGFGCAMLCWCFRFMGRICLHAVNVSAAASGKNIRLEYPWPYRLSNAARTFKPVHPFLHRSRVCDRRNSHQSIPWCCEAAITPDTALSETENRSKATFREQDLSGLGQRQPHLSNWPQSGLFQTPGDIELAREFYETLKQDSE